MEFSKRHFVFTGETGLFCGLFLVEACKILWQDYCAVKVCAFPGKQTSREVKQVQFIFCIECCNKIIVTS